MLYTIASPDHQADGVRLFLRLEDALAARSHGQRLRGVAVHYDGLLHRLIPLLASSRAWTAPASNLGDGSVITREPIPASLFLEANLQAAYVG
jgi:hypothetical protein